MQGIKQGECHRLINITFNNAKRTLTVEGHANYAEKGKDIVCSAISVLTDTLYKTLKSYEQTALREPVKLKEKDGYKQIKYSVKSKYEQNIAIVLFTILNGYEGVANTYPDYVKFEYE